MLFNQIFADHNPAKITNGDEDSAKWIYFKDNKFPVKTRGIHKIWKKNSIGIGGFGYENKVKYPIFVSKIYRYCVLIMIHLLRLLNHT